MIYVVWYTNNDEAEDNGILCAFYDHAEAIEFADDEEAKRHSEGIFHTIWVDAVEVE